MDTFRSEVSTSSDALGSSRFGGSSSSLSFSLASSRTSARSDLVSAFEQKFLERCANAKRKREREKKRQENNQRAESAEEKWRVEREKARESRRREMQDWVPTPEALRRVEHASRQRSRARMREIRDWYPLPSSDGTAKGVDNDEMLPVFGDQPPHCRAGTRQRGQEVIEQERQALETSMKRRLAALKDKVAYLENIGRDATAIVVRTPTRVGRLDPLERTAFSSSPLANVALERTPETRSMSALPDHRDLDHRSKLQSSQALVGRIRTTTASCSVSKRSRQWHRLHQSPSGSGSLDDELEREADERDEAEMRLFLAAHHRIARRDRAATTLQAAWRGFLRRRVFLRWSRRRWAFRGDVFSVWAMAHRVGKLAQRSLLRSCLSQWRREVALLARLRELEFKLFVGAEKQPVSAPLPKLVVNLALASDEWEGDDVESRNGDSGQEEEAPPPSIAAPTDRLVLGGLVNAAFAGVQQAAALDGAGRVRLHRLRHAEARANVRRKIAQRVFLSWKRAHASHRRSMLNAQLCLKRAGRLFMASIASASTSKGVWPQEKLLAVFDMWARYAAFSRCRRTGAPLPEFSQPSAQWGIWLHNFQERQVRKIKAAARASVARQRRFLVRIRVFARMQRAKRERLELAIRFASATLRRRVLLEWRAAIADQAANKKCCRRAMEALRTYTVLKRRLRPLKQIVAESTARYGAKRAWRAWSSVHLRAVCKRAWNVARITHFPEWRRRVMRTLLVWRWRPRRRIESESDHGSASESQQVNLQSSGDELVAREQAEAADDGEEDPFGSQLRLWRVLTAWRHSTRKRGLFRSLRFHCARLRRKRLLFAVLNAWKQQVWKLADDGGDDSDGDSAMKHVAFLEDRLGLDPWNVYREVSPMLPMLFFGYYSDAAAVFGGVSSVNIIARSGPKTSDAPAQRIYSALEVRQFHRVLADESLAEVRNVVLRSKHLVNAVDPTTGDSALHVVLQGEDRARRLEVLALLLTEGAATLDRPNRHELTARQLAAKDPDAQRLLTMGVYAYFEAAAADQDKRDDNDADQFDNVVLWRVVALMLGELQRDARVAADTRHGVWHSQLREELWLRQGSMRFPANSLFLPSVLRCRAYLDGMRKRISRPIKRALGVDTGAAESPPLIEEQYGELAPYARFLLSPLLEHDAAEAVLIHSFVGVLYSLEFPLQEITDEAFRLEDVCSSIEGELSSTWEQLQSSERRLATVLAPLVDRAMRVESAIPLLRYFKDQSGMEYTMKREMMLNLHESHSQQLAQAQANASSNDNLQHQVTVAAILALTEELKEAVGLKVLAQRKMRKLEKRLKTLEEQLPVHESGFRESLVADGRSVRDICAERMKLECKRLSKTSLLVKKADLQLLLSKLDGMIASAKGNQSQSAAMETPSREQAGSIAGESSLQGIHTTNAAFPATMLSSQVKARLERQLEALSCVFQAVDTAASDGVNDSPPSNAAGAPTSVPTPASPKEIAAVLIATIPSLQKRLDSLLRELFITNMFRTFCCWLVENMALSSITVASEDQQVENQDISATSAGSAAGESSSTVASLTSVDECYDVTMQRSVRRRRTSLTNTRRVLETFQRDGTSIDMLDRDIDRMKETYADSSNLLFKAERAAILGVAGEQRRVQERVESTKVITNPITGMPEEAPVHTVDPMVSIEPSAAQKAKETARVRRNRKKEELRHAMMLRQLDRMAVKVRQRSSVATAYTGEGNDDETDSDTDEVGGPVLPTVHGDALPLGNFILRSLNDNEPITSDIDLASWTDDGDSSLLSSTLQEMEPGGIEAMWKRGARAANKGTNVVGQNANPGSSPATNATYAQSVTPDPAKRVLSASRRTAESDPATRHIRMRRSSVHGAGAKLDVGLPVQFMERGIKRGESEHDVVHAKCEWDDRSDAHHEEAIGSTWGCASQADDSSGRSETSATPLSMAKLLHHYESPIVFEESTDDGGGDMQNELQDVDSSGQIAVAVTAELTDLSLFPADDGGKATSVSELSGKIANSAADAAAAAEVLDAYLANMQSRPLPSDISDESALLSSPDHVELSSRSTDASGDDRVHQDACNPLIVWEMQPEVVREYPMVVQRLQQSGSTRVRHVIEYDSTVETLATPLTIGILAQRALGTSVPDVATRVRWGEGEDALDSPLSLHGRSLRMEGHRGRSELPQRSQQAVLNADTDCSVLSTHATGPDRGAAIDYDATTEVSERDVAVPAVTISVVATTVTHAATDEKHTSADTEEARTGPLPASNPRRGPFFVLDTDGSTTTTSKLQSLEITSVNARGAVIATPTIEQATGIGPSRANATKTPTTKKTYPETTSKAKRAVSKVDELRRARTKRVDTPQSASCGDLLLEGANLRSASKPGIEPLKQESAPLTKQQKARVWKEFAAAPLSDVMQNAYAELYPQTYARVASTETIDHSSASSHGLLSSASSPAVQLAVRPASIPKREKTSSPTTCLELDKKFWRAVEGYRAIGSSLMVPLDEATIRRRRQDQAERIYASFLVEDIESLIPGQSRQLEWVAMYPEQVAAVRRRLKASPVDLFDPLQQTAQLRITTALASADAAVE